MGAYNGAVGTRSTDYDYTRSDNYMYKGRLLTYDHYHGSVLAGACLFGFLGLWSLGIAYRMTVEWRDFYHPKKESDKWRDKTLKDVSLGDLLRETRARVKRALVRWVARTPWAAAAASAVLCIFDGDRLESGLIVLARGGVAMRVLDARR